MRKRALLVVGVFTILAVLAVPAMGVTLSAGDKEIKFNDWSNLYYDHDANAATPMMPRPLSGAAPTAGDENRAILRVTTIRDVASDTFDYNAQTDPQEITGMFYNLELLSVSVAGSVVFLDFGPSARNPLPGTLPLTGGVLEVYTDGTRDFTSDPGNVGNLEDILPAAPPIAIPDAPPVPSPSAPPNNAGPGDGGPRFWDEGQLVGPGVRDAYPGSTDGGLWLSGAYIDFAQMGIVGHAPGTVLTETLDLSTGIGSGFARLHAMGGSLLPSLQTGKYGVFPGADGLLGTADDISAEVEIIFNIATPRFDAIAGLLRDVGTYQGEGYWQVDSNDPSVFGVIPEPATLSLLGTGLIGLFTVRRRRRRSR
jgi:hypothetical protein